jgi:hypothetical protein
MNLVGRVYLKNYTGGEHHNTTYNLYAEFYERPENDETLVEMRGYRASEDIEEKKPHVMSPARPLFEALK